LVSFYNNLRPFYVHHDGHALADTGTLTLGAIQAIEKQFTLVVTGLPSRGIKLEANLGATAGSNHYFVSR
jgi:hypothetical protein